MKVFINFFFKNFLHTKDLLINKPNLIKIDEEILKILSHILNYDPLSAYKIFKDELDSLHDNEMYDRIDFIRRANTRIMLIQDQINSNEFGYHTKIFKRIQLFKFKCVIKINNLILMKFYNIDGSKTQKHRREPYIEKKDKTLCADEILSIIDKSKIYEKD